MSPFIHALIQSVQEIAQALQERHEGLYHAHTQGYGGDVSKGVDLIAEAILYRHLHPFGSIFSEESGWMDPPSEWVITIDPIDGSDNFVSWLPYYGLCVARSCDGITHEAMVCNLATQELLIRTREEYTTFSLITQTFTPIVTNPFSTVGIFEKSHENLPLAAQLINNGFKFRSPGALALSLAYAPYVRYVLFLGTMRPFDIQAGLYLSNHLHVFHDDHTILISHDEEVFKSVLALIHKEIS